VLNLFNRKPHPVVDEAIYAAIVAASRRPELYLAFDVPDSIEGRYEMLMLHAFLYLHRLKGEDEEARAIGQAVFDRLFAELDHSLREMGVGDLSVPKRIKKMATSFYGRISAYDVPLAANDFPALEEALARNVYPERSDALLLAKSLAPYVTSAAALLGTMTREDLLRSGPRFPDPALASDSSGEADG